MRKVAKKLGIPLIALVFLLASLGGAVELQAGQGKGKGKGKGKGPVAVSEPAAIALLGAGLVSLGLYVKRKKKK